MGTIRARWPEPDLRRSARCSRDRAVAPRVSAMTQLPLGDGGGGRRRDVRAGHRHRGRPGRRDRARALAAAGDPGGGRRAPARDRHRPAGLRPRQRSTRPHRCSATSAWGCSSSSPATRSTSSGSRAGRSSSAVSAGRSRSALAYGIGGVLAAAGVILSFLYTGSAMATTAIGTLIPILQRRRRDAHPLRHLPARRGRRRGVRPDPAGDADPLHRPSAPRGGDPDPLHRPGRDHGTARRALRVAGLAAGREDVRDLAASSPSGSRWCSSSGSSPLAASSASTCCSAGSWPA